MYIQFHAEYCLLLFHTFCFVLILMQALKSLTGNVHPIQQLEFIDSFCTPLFKVDYMCTVHVVLYHHYQYRFSSIFSFKQAVSIVHAGLDPLLASILKNRMKWVGNVRAMTAVPSSSKWCTQNDPTLHIRDSICMYILYTVHACNQ